MCGGGKGSGCASDVGGGDEDRSGCGGGVRGEALSLPAWSGPGGEGDDPSLLSMGLLDLLSQFRRSRNVRSVEQHYRE